MGLHRSTTPSDHSCSAPTSPVSHSISPINSPGLPQNASSLSKSPFLDNSYYNAQQTSVLQHQLEQFRMVADLQNDTSDQYLMVMRYGKLIRYTCNVCIFFFSQDAGKWYNSFFK